MTKPIWCHSNLPGGGWPDSGGDLGRNSQARRVQTGNGNANQRVAVWLGAAKKHQWDHPTRSSCTWPEEFQHEVKCQTTTCFYFPVWNDLRPPHCTPSYRSCRPAESVNSRVTSGHGLPLTCEETLWVGGWRPYITCYILTDVASACRIWWEGDFVQCRGFCVHSQPRGCYQCGWSIRIMSDVSGYKQIPGSGGTLWYGTFGMNGTNAPEVAVNVKHQLPECRPREIFKPLVSKEAKWHPRSCNAAVLKTKPCSRPALHRHPRIHLRVRSKVYSLLLAWTRRLHQAAPRRSLSQKLRRYMSPWRIHDLI